jgi:hypothetical protein
MLFMNLMVGGPLKVVFLWGGEDVMPASLNDKLHAVNLALELRLCVGFFLRMNFITNDGLF